MCGAICSWFSSKTPLKDGMVYEDGAIYEVKDGVREKVINVDEMMLIGRHNYENVMAAVAAARFMNVPMELIREGQEPRGQGHRVQPACLTLIPLRQQDPEAQLHRDCYQDYARCPLLSPRQLRVRHRPHRRQGLPVLVCPLAEC